MSHLKNLPTDISTFSRIREKNCVYVDKTEHMYRMFGGAARYYFLSRPRRFGKSLLVSTLKELFLGNKKLFDGLWIEQSDWEWEEHPVVHLDFSTIAHETSVELKSSLAWTLNNIGASFGVNVLDAPTLGDKFRTLVEGLALKNKVVILIDEYDKPIIDHITNLEIAEKNRAVLKGFYDVLKGLDAHLRAIFVTGVSKFTKTSIFSGINNLNDISQKPQAASLLGYTQQELEYYFAPYIADIAQAQKKSRQDILDEMKKWYNGYRFCQEDVRVYNPFSILYYLNDKKRANYWFESGTPTFLMELLKKQKEHLRDFSGVEVTDAELGPFELNKIPLIPVLYQTGYLTIVDSFKRGNTDMFKLAPPNEEVRESFSRCVLTTLTPLTDATVVTIAQRIEYALLDNDIPSLCKQIQTLIASIPYELHIELEHYYHSLFLTVLNLTPFFVHAEDHTSIGSVDLVIITSERIFILELKFNKPVTKAMDQIHKKQYYEKYLGNGKPITLAGISFKYVEKKLTVEWVEEQV